MDGTDSGVPRKAVIVAAGFGTRMGRVPKGLLKVAGREILQRTVLILSGLGVSSFVIVTNEEYSDPYQRFLRKNGIDAEVVINHHPERGNGYSLHVAKGHVSGRFILTMADHVYSVDFLRAAAGGRGLIADREPRFTDVEESTKVRIAGDRVVDIGKDLKEWDAVDTGFFVLDDGIFDVTSGLLKENQVVTLSDVVRRARLRVTFVDGLPWMDVDTPADVKKARRMLVKASVKGKGDGFVSRHLNRRVSTWISCLLVERVGPGPMTVLTFVVGVISAVLNLWSLPLAVVLYQFDSILDGVDGELARARLETSKFGGYLDSILDRYVDGLFIALLAYRSVTGHSWYFVVLMVLLGSVMVSYSTERFKGAYLTDPYDAIRVLRYLPGKRDERVFITMVLVLCGMTRPFFVLMAFLTNVRVIATVYLVRRSTFTTENYLMNMKYLMKEKEV